METSSEVQDKSTYRLCRNTDCERYPDDEDFDKDNEAEYQPRGEWQKCNICDGYFVDDGLNDIFFIEEEPNNRKAQCHLCGNEDDVVQMKGTGEYLCGNGCDEEDADDE